jgi:FAD:protein FMN transferase
MRNLQLCWVLIASVMVCAGCAAKSQQLSISGPTMGTQYLVRVASLPNAVDEQQVRAAITAVLMRIDASMSGYRADSEIARFNASASTDWIDVSADLAKVVAAAAEVSAQSHGTLDITVAPLVDLWGFGPSGPRAAVPAAAAVSQVRAHVGYHKLEVRLSPPALRKQDPLLTVDLNAIAPGYAVDLLTSELTRLGLGDFLIDIGGEVRVHGDNAKGHPWRVAVEKPQDGEREPLTLLELRELAVTTSGEYRHYDMRGGKRYSHTIDPRTAAPLEHDLAAVVVVNPSAMLADAWATALNVLGEHDGYALAEQRRMPALFVTQRSGRWQLRATPWIEPYFAPSAQLARR